MAEPIDNQTDAPEQPVFRTPMIEPIDWEVAADVLGGEATHFTPWLAEHLDLLGDVLGIEGLELVATESDISGKRLDVLAAVGAEQDGETVGVAIENQYGMSRHDHLGQLVTYVAGVATSYDRVLGVWLVDQVHPAHEAAVDLLNRETTERLGFVLATPRFIQLGADRWGVDFVVAVRPNEFVRSERRRASSSNPERHQFLDDVLDVARPELIRLGYRTVGNARAHGYTADISWGDSRWRVNVRVTEPDDRFRAMVYVNGFESTEENERFLARLTSHEDLIRAELQAPHELDLEAHKTNAYAKKAALAVCRWPGLGYGSDPTAAAERLLEFCAGVAAAAKAAGV